MQGSESKTSRGQCTTPMVEWGAGTVSFAARLTEKEMQAAMADARLEHRKGHLKATLAAVKGIGIVRECTLRMRRCSSESVWNSAAPSVPVGQHGKQR